MDLAPVNAMNFMRYKFFLTFLRFELESRPPEPPWLRHWLTTADLLAQQNPLFRQTFRI